MRKLYFRGPKKPTIIVPRRAAQKKVNVLFHEAVLSDIICELVALSRASSGAAFFELRQSTIGTSGAKNGKHQH